MSNEPNFAYKRPKRDKAAEKTFTIDDDSFRLRPKIGTVALDAIGRAQADETDPAALCGALRALLADDAEYARFIALDLDDEELAEVIQGIVGMYGDAGKSSGSPRRSKSNGASSKPTSLASTAPASAT